MPRPILGFVLGLLCCAQVGTIGAQQAQYPSKPIRLIVPFPPGGPTDILGRMVAQIVTEDLGQPVIVENHPGAGGTLGTGLAAKAPGDGYTLLVGAPAPLATNVALVKNLSYDPLKDLEPVIQLAAVPLVIIVHPGFPAKDLGEFIAELKAKPGQYAYASSGNGTPQHLAGELFKKSVGVNMVHVPYKGSAPALSDVVAGHVLIMFESMVGLVPHIKANRVRALAVAATARAAQLPHVPTTGEAGTPDFKASSWYGILASKGTSSVIVDKLNAVIRAGLDRPQFRARLEEMGSARVQSSPADFKQLLDSEVRLWTQVVKEARITLD